MFKDITSRIFTAPFLITIARYALNAIGVWLVANGYFDENAWAGVSGGILMIVTAFLGGADSVTNKVVVGGKSISADKLPLTTQEEIKRVANHVPKRNLFSILFGR